MKKANYRLVFCNNDNSLSIQRDVYAKDSDKALHLAHQMPEANDRRFTNVWSSKIPEGASVIGVEFLYTDTAFKKDFHGIINIRAESEKQAIDYYNKHYKGTRFWFSDSKIEPDGKCVRGKVLGTFFSAAPGYAADATKEAV